MVLNCKKILIIKLKNERLVFKNNFNIDVSQLYHTITIEWMVCSKKNEVKIIKKLAPSMQDNIPILVRYSDENGSIFTKTCVFSEMSIQRYGKYPIISINGIFFDGAFDLEAFNENKKLHEND